MKTLFCMALGAAVGWLVWRVSPPRFRGTARQAPPPP